MKKVKIGVIGVGRGKSMMRFCLGTDRAELVAVCDKWEPGLDMLKKKYADHNITYYTDYDEFLKHDMDAVVLANYAIQHAPFAIKALKAGKHVLSEVMAVQTLAEAVQLVEAVEETGMIYAYAENYCYMPATREMRKLFKEGKLGEFEYGEGEYIHNCVTIWPEITYGDPTHWRNNTYATYYCSHALGPILHMCGLRPVSVTGFEGIQNQRSLDIGCKRAQYGILMTTLENGAIVKTAQGGLYRDSVWYTVYGSKGRMESAREDADRDDVHRIYINCDEYEGEYAKRDVETYLPEMAEGADEFGHAGSDYYCMNHFINKLLGEDDDDVIDVYEALDMALPGLMAHRSILQGNIPMEVPNMRLKEVRDKYRNDHACTDPKVAGDQLLPHWSKGELKIEPEVYDRVREKWLEVLARKEKENN